MARITPPNLERALSRVKAYVMRYPNGVEESDLYKVDAFTVLNKKDRQQLTAILESTDAVHVTRTGKPGKEKLWFRHMKFVGAFPTPGGDLAPPEPVEPQPVVHQCMACGRSKPISKFTVVDGQPLESCRQCLKKIREETMVAKQTTQKSDVFANFTPEQLISLSDQLRHRAEEVKEVQAARSTITKQLEPIRREVLQAHQKVTKAFDVMVDGMAELDKAMGKLREFKVEI